MNPAAAALDRFVRGVEAEGLRAHGVHVRIGEDAASRMWSVDERRDIHSVAKAVCVIAAGMAADEGLFDLDAPIGRYLPGLATGEDVATVPVRRLFTLTSGIDLPWSPTMFTDHADLAAEFLSRPSRGPVFQYSNASTYTAMRALETVTGDVYTWLDERLFSPLEIATPHWDRCPTGRVLGGGGLWLTLDELARIGWMLRDRGTWQGRRLVSPRWVDAMHADWVVAGPNPGYDRYAFGGWAGPGDAWRLHGAYGQLVVFSGDAVVTITSDDHPGDGLAVLAVAAVGG